ncbi:hypothetical protein Taro_001709, partial [Colocasia esculenta]|nr:hypothetical protein [Colocasia esculenta]
MLWEQGPVSTCSDAVSTCCPNSTNRLFWELSPVSTCSESVSTCCPNSASMLFWELSPVSTCSESVSTWIEILPTFLRCKDPRVWVDEISKFFLLQASLFLALLVLSLLLHCPEFQERKWGLTPTSYPSHLWRGPDVHVLDPKLVKKLALLKHTQQRH